MSIFLTILDVFGSAFNPVPALGMSWDVMGKVNMVLNVHRNHTAYSGRGEGERGVWRWGEREIIYLSLHCHHHNDSCIKMGSDESHFNV